MHPERLTSSPLPAAPRSARRRVRTASAVVALAGLALVGPACSQDTSEGGSSPEDQPTGGPQQPGGGEDDPTLSGEGGGQDEGNTGGDGSGGPDSESGSGGDEGVGGSPTGGEDG